MTSERLNYIDEMKGFAILLVTMGHIYLNNTIEGQNHPIAQIIYSFHMSFFFFLSGFILSKTHKLETSGIMIFIKNKTITLLLPWLSFSIIVKLFLNPNISIYKLLDGLLFYPVNGYWFLPILWIFMMLWLLQKIASSYINVYAEPVINIFITCIIASTGLFLHKYHIIIYSIYYMAFIGGYFLSRYNSIEKILKKKEVVGISAIILIVTWNLGPIETYGVAWRSFINLLHQCICSISACIVLYNLFLNNPFPKFIKKYLQNTGKHSLAIYLLPMTLIPNGYIFPHDFTSSFINITILLTATFINYICYLIAIIIYKIPYINLLLFGKR